MEVCMGSNDQKQASLTPPKDPTKAFYAFMRDQGAKAEAEQRQMNAGKSPYQLVTGGGQSLPG
jgi:hypothetical protein